VQVAFKESKTNNKNDCSIEHGKLKIRVFVEHAHVDLF